MPPDNQAHHLGVNGGYNLSPLTRLGFTFSLGRQTQDEQFLPYSATPGIVINTPLPRSSLDGKVNTTFLNLNATSRVVPRLTLRGSYTFDERDDRTPQSRFLYIGGDSQSPQLGVASDRARTNLPLSHKKHLVKLDADYLLRPGTKLNAGYDYEQIHREHEEVDKTKEHTLRAGLNGRQFNSTTKAAANVDTAFPPGDWFVSVDNDADTFGLGFKITGIRGRIDFGGDFIHTRSTGHIDPSATTLTALPLPDNKAHLTGLQLYATYLVQKNSSVKLSLLHQKYHESDWAWDNVRPTEMANVISTGQQPPDYSVNVVGVSYIHRFQ